jgi:SAM-dependent methyltransferase
VSGYLSRHTAPGYWRDVTGHFDSADRILDVGCGTGWVGEHFERYLGLDGSPEAVAAARELGRNVRRHDLDEPLELDDETFDGVILEDVLEHIGNPVDLVREVHRVLRPGGRLFASSPDAQRWAWDDYTHRRPFTRKAYRLLFADQGFDVLRATYESVVPGSSIISDWTRAKRRPAALRAAAWLPLLRRNVFVVARRSP